jgi:hypothetical protein
MSKAVWGFPGRYLGKQAAAKEAAPPWVLRMQTNTGVMETYHMSYLVHPRG